MTERAFFDTLTVSKGPEDGVQFPITSTPVLVGRDPACLVNLQFDVTIQPEHARIALGRGGYRVRRVTGAPVHVDGAGAGRIRSRVLRPGQSLRVGYTDLVLRCAEGGHAATGSVSWSESDVAWALRAVTGTGRNIAELAAAHMVKATRTAAVNWRWTLVLAAIIAYAAIEPLRDYVNGWLSHIRDRF
jgi:hypothetical protein